MDNDDSKFCLPRNHENDGLRADLGIDIKIFIYKDRNGVEKLNIRATDIMGTDIDVIRAKYAFEHMLQNVVRSLRHAKPIVDLDES